MSGSITQEIPVRQLMMRPSGPPVRAELRQLVGQRPANENLAPDPERTVWERLMQGEWKLLDQFDSDGQRHVVAAACAPGERASALSRQQRRVVRAAGEGWTSREIAKHLDMTERAVDNQLRRAMHKLGLDNRIELVRLFCALERAGQL